MPVGQTSAGGSRGGPKRVAIQVVLHDSSGRLGRLATALNLARPNQTTITADVNSPTDGQFYSFTTPVAGAPEPCGRPA